MENSKIWISTALCLGCKEQIWNTITTKLKFQYFPLAGLLSTKLWYHLFPAKVNVIFHLIICEEESIINQQQNLFGDYNLSEYITKLNNTGAKIVVSKIKNCEDCVMKSRIARMLAYKIPEVRAPITVSMHSQLTSPT